MSYDPCKVATITASAGAATNALAFPLLIHRVAVEHADGTAQARIDLFDAATATGTAIVSIELALADGTTFKTYESVGFNPPIAVETGVSSTVGNSAVTKIYYTRR
jgi:hypothetical protein